MNKFLMLLLASTSITVYAEPPKEMYMANDAGGYVVLTDKECPFAEVKVDFPYSAYATESSEMVRHEGCWTSPDTSEVPSEIYSKSEGAGIPPTIRVINMVNTWWVEGGKATFFQSSFKPTKNK